VHPDKASGIELAFQLSNAPWIAITGTNGKSTTTALAGALFTAAGYDAHVCGNIGVAATDEALAATAPNAVLVAEVSSFQLERVVTFRPHVAVVLGLTLLIKETAYLFTGFMVVGPALLGFGAILLVVVILRELRARKVL